MRDPADLNYDHSPEAIRRANERWLKRKGCEKKYKPNINHFFKDSRTVKKMNAQNREFEEMRKTNDYDF